MIIVGVGVGASSSPIYKYGLGTLGLPCTLGSHHYGEDASHRYPTPLFMGTRPRASIGPVGLISAGYPRLGQTPGTFGATFGLSA